MGPWHTDQKKQTDKATVLSLKLYFKSQHAAGISIFLKNIWKSLFLSDKPLKRIRFLSNTSTRRQWKFNGERLHILTLTNKLLWSTEHLSAKQTFKRKHSWKQKTVCSRLFWGQLRQHQMKVADNQADRRQAYVPSPGWAVKDCWPARPPCPAPYSPSPPRGRERRPDQSTCSLGRASWWTGTYGSPLRIHPGKGRKSSWREHVVCRWQPASIFNFISESRATSPSALHSSIF